MKHSRPTFLTTGLAFAAFPSRVRAQSLATIRVAGSPDEDIVGSLYGVQSGIFKKYGLDVQVTRANSGSAFQSARDLNGATIAVPALGDLFTIVNA